ERMVGGWIARRKRLVGSLVHLVPVLRRIAHRFRPRWTRTVARTVGDGGRPLVRLLSHVCLLKCAGGGPRAPIRPGFCKARAKTALGQRRSGPAVPVPRRWRARQSALEMLDRLIQGVAELGATREQLIRPLHAEMALAVLRGGGAAGKLRMALRSRAIFPCLGHPIARLTTHATRAASPVRRAGLGNASEAEVVSTDGSAHFAEVLQRRRR